MHSILVNESMKCIPRGRFIVQNIDMRTGSCRQWNVTGIPCTHGMAEIKYHRGEKEFYVDKCYHKDTYMRSYAYIISPIADEKTWPDSGRPKPPPPPFHKRPGRPKKARKKAAGEKMSKTTEEDNIPS